MARYLVTKAFRNVKGLKAESKLLHPDHLHKGCTIIIGDKAETKLEDMDAKDRQTVAELNRMGLLVDATDEKGVKKLNEELEADKERKKEDQARAKQSGILLKEQADNLTAVKK